MAHRKAAITIVVGVLCILFATLFIIASGLTMGWCNFNDCTYTASYGFANILFLVGIILTVMGFAFGGASNDALVSEGEQDG